MDVNASSSKALNKVQYGETDFSFVALEWTDVDEKGCNTGIRQRLEESWKNEGMARAAGRRNQDFAKPYKHTNEGRR